MDSRFGSILRISWRQLKIPVIAQVPDRQPEVTPFHLLAVFAIKVIDVDPAIV